jgi:short-subunit dehydrogenase
MKYLETFKGKWTLITGASQGIGLEYCTELAAHGVNIFMVARSGQQLQKIQEDLQKKYNIKAEYCAIDLSDKNAVHTVYASVRSHNIHISLVCNNVAIGKMGDFTQPTIEEYVFLTQINTTTAIALAHIFYSDLKAAHGVLINVSSQAALQPVPYMAVYGGSKAFLHSWSLALSEEWREHGIFVQTVVPGPTQTNFDTHAGSYKNKITRRTPPFDIVSRSIRALPSQKRIVTNVPLLKVQQVLGVIMPISTILKIIAKIFRPPTVT